eukprot:1745656-Rhodomonas_salina.1
MQMSEVNGTRSLAGPILELIRRTGKPSESGGPRIAQAEAETTTHCPPYPPKSQHKKPQSSVAHIVLKSRFLVLLGFGGIFNAELSLHPVTQSAFLSRATRPRFSFALQVLSANLASLLLRGASGGSDSASQRSARKVLHAERGVRRVGSQRSPGRNTRHTTCD